MITTITRGGCGRHVAATCATYVAGVAAAPEGRHAATYGVCPTPHHGRRATGRAGAGAHPGKSAPARRGAENKRVTRNAHAREALDVVA